MFCQFISNHFELENDVKMTLKCCAFFNIRVIFYLFLYTVLLTGLSLRAGGRGFSPATKRVAPGYFYWKIEEK